MCYEEHQYAKSVIAGDHHDDRYFAYIRAAEPGDDLNDPAVWAKANPSLGITIKEDEFAADIREANKSPSSRAAMARYSFNLWSTSTNPAIKLDDWARCKQTYTDDDLIGRECYAGLDLGQVSDMSALVLLFPDGEDGGDEEESPPTREDEEATGEEAKVDRAILDAATLRVRFKALCYFWLPEATIDDPSNPNARTYQGWLAGGHLLKTPGNVVDYGFIRRQIITLSKRFTLRSLSYDPMFAEQLTQELEESHAIKRVPFTQGMTSYAAPTVAFERAIIAGRFGHAGHPILNWHVGNLAFYENSNGYKRPVKPKGSAQHKKIDGATAAIMALGGVLLSPPDTRSVYESRGFIAI